MADEYTRAALFCIIGCIVFFIVSQITAYVLINYDSPEKNRAVAYISIWVYALIAGVLGYLFTKFRHNARYIKEKESDYILDDPKKDTDDFSLHTVEELDKMLDQALKKEDYELAGKLRDEKSRRNG